MPGVSTRRLSHWVRRRWSSTSRVVFFERFYACCVPRVGASESKTATIKEEAVAVEGAAEPVVEAAVEAEAVVEAEATGEASPEPTVPAE